ncbi:MAG TPA: hypothetical protein VFT45_00690, partial [Longimicrobium sp.]|nr:hypothetical protein [Longimicrobium sp.]
MARTSLPGSYTGPNPPDSHRDSGGGAGLAALALSGCSTSMDHHYVFPAGAGDLLEAEIRAAGSVGVRFHACR